MQLAISICFRRRWAYEAKSPREAMHCLGGARGGASSIRYWKSRTCVRRQKRLRPFFLTSSFTTNHGQLPLTRATLRLRELSCSSDNIFFWQKPPQETLLKDEPLTLRGPFGEGKRKVRRIFLILAWRGEFTNFYNKLKTIKEKIFKGKMLLEHRMKF